MNKIYDEKCYPVEKKVQKIDIKNELVDARDLFIPINDDSEILFYLDPYTVISVQSKVESIGISMSKGTTIEVVENWISTGNNYSVGCSSPYDVQEKVLDAFIKYFSYEMAKIGALKRIDKNMCMVMAFEQVDDISYRLQFSNVVREHIIEIRKRKEQIGNNK